MHLTFRPQCCPLVTKFLQIHFYCSFVRELRTFESRKANFLVRVSYHFEQTWSWIIVDAYIWRMMLLDVPVGNSLTLKFLVGDGERMFQYFQRRLVFPKIDGERLNVLCCNRFRCCRFRCKRNFHTVGDLPGLQLYLLMDQIRDMCQRQSNGDSWNRK